ncbi:putative calcium-transporting ATPase 13, plasma membrane-type [Salvia hispanica]|uniref:putative calcium-transporting ATPase 13, plasma membrane-type n=1 Tax=Salvia hispanica TaxID=49212 RepID=UPI0020091104|nr:putative calcium-transporting ATPase 13, plasma membrane-type [Salvia hispanica]XP_047937887.1 putative calcium-transporting ATPase 13, plasma membrane-type [Salvia hispanica]
MQLANSPCKSPPIIGAGVAGHQPKFSGVSPSTLNHLVKDKNLHQLSLLDGARGIAASLKTDSNVGITGDEEDLAARKQAFGTNTYPSPPTKTFLHFILKTFKDREILFLLAFAVFSLAWYKDGITFIVVILSIAFSAFSNFKLCRLLDKPSSNISAEVVRNGRRQDVSIYEVVVGDIVCLKIGDQVPADGLFLDGHSLRLDESSMTGETGLVDANPFLLSGTTVADGYGKMVVTSVGMNTMWGETMSKMNQDTDQETPLQIRLSKITITIEKLGTAVAFLVHVVLLIRYIAGADNGVRGFDGPRTKPDDVINFVGGVIEETVSTAVVATLEGLNLKQTLTLTHAYFMKKMMADQAMVRNLSACETLGYATVICTHKTGTLTMNKMKVTKFWLGKHSFEGGLNMARCVLELLREGAGLNTTGGVYTSREGLEFSGSPTEKAILSWAVADLGMDMEEVKSGCEILEVEAFKSEMKRSGVLMKRDHEFHVHWKGAAEVILAMCSHYYDLDGNKNDMSDEERLQFNHIIQGMSASSLRCIAFAHKQLSNSECDEVKKIQEDNMVLLGLVGLKDPYRPDVKQEVEDCQNAGVDVKMITGDNVFTAKAVATECGILRPGQDQDGCVVEGVEFRSYAEEERMKRVEAIRVMARSSPMDKLLMVQCLKKRDLVVAVTGHGTHDAQALKEADIGLSMGIQSTEVAKKSSDIVIMDNNFTSVVTVFKWERCVYNNIQKFIQFKLTADIAALTIESVVAVSSGKMPLAVVQLLWVNLIMNTLGLGGLALATEKLTRDQLMERRPVGRHEPLISKVMWRNLMAQAVYQIVVLLVLQFRGEGLLGVSEGVKNTMIFNTFVLCQVFNVFNARKLEKRNVFEGLHKNKLFVGIVGVTLVLQALMVELLNKFADTERLSLEEWGICVGIGALSWPIAWLVKLIPFPDETVGGTTDPTARP